MNWRQVARALKEQEGGRDVRGETGAIVPNVPIVPRGVSLNCPSHWRARLAALDPDNPPTMVDPQRWRTLIDDARWLAEAHGKAAAGFGWSAAQLFGIDGAPGWGGLVDRIDGARRVALTAETARWRNEHEDGKLWRKGCTGGVPVWELAQ